MKKVFLPMIAFLILTVFSSCNAPVETDKPVPPVVLSDVKTSITFQVGFPTTLLKNIKVSITSPTASGATKVMSGPGDVLFSGLKPGAAYKLEALAYGNDGLVYLKGSYNFASLSEGVTPIGLVLNQSRVTPVISDIPEGTHPSAIDLLLSTNLTMAKIFYTLDGSDPLLPGAPEFTGKISLVNKQDYHLRVAAKLDGYDNSPVSDLLYSISSGGLTPPAISPNGGSITDDDFIALTVPVGSTVYYTLDGSTPTKSSQKYIGPFKLPVGTTTLKAVAFGSTVQSTMTTASFTVKSSTPEAPQISPADGSYETSANVTMVQAAGLDIHYTMDGAQPLITSPVFPTSITHSTLGTTVFKAVSFNGAKASPITTRTITIVTPGTLAAPDITPADGTFENSVTVTMTQAAATEIRYTLDGSTPSATSTLYAGPFPINTKGTVILKAIARTATKTSSVTTRTYTITTPTPVATSVTLSADKSSVAPGVVVNFTAVVLDQFGSAMVSEATTIYNGASALPGKTFSSNVEGTYTFTAKSGILTSPAVNVLVKNTPVDIHYSTNPNQQVGKYKAGMNVTCTSTLSDGFTDWTPDMLIAQGAGFDDAKSFKGPHEYPSYDSYSLYAAWDDANLYLGWQYVYVHDIAKSDNNGGNEARPTNGDCPQMLVFDIDSTKSSVGTMKDGRNLWYDKVPGTFMSFDKALGVDKIAMFSSKGGVGSPSLFSMDADGFFSYANGKLFNTAGIVYGAIYGLLPATIYGVKKDAYVPADLDLSSDWVEFVSLGHNKSLDTFYEMKIPFTALGITRSDLETKGIGVMYVSIYGTSGVDSLPKDKTATLDNALEAYTLANDNTTKEKQDHDNFTVPLARIGKF